MLYFKQMWMSVTLEDMVVTAPSFATTRMLAAVWSVSTLPNASTHTDVTNVVAELGSQETELPVLVNTLLLVQLKYCYVHVLSPHICRCERVSRANRM